MLILAIALSTAAAEPQPVAAAVPEAPAPCRPAPRRHGFLRGLAKGLSQTVPFMAARGAGAQLITGVVSGAASEAARDEATPAISTCADSDR